MASYLVTMINSKQMMRCGYTAVKVGALQMNNLYQQFLMAVKQDLQQTKQKLFTLEDNKMFSLGGHNYEADDHLEIVHTVQSEITIADLKKFIDSLCPVKIFVDGKLVWDDFADDGELCKRYDEVTTRKTLVATVSVEIVCYHHSIIYLNTVFDGGFHGGKNHS